MNLLTVIHYPVFGGPHNTASRLNAQLSRCGWNTSVLIPDEPGTAGERLRDANIDVITAPLHRLRATGNPITQARFLVGFWRDVGTIRRLIRDGNFDLIQVNGLVSPQSAIAGRMEGVPVVWQIQDTRPPMILRRVLMPLVARLADAIMFNGNTLTATYPGASALAARSFIYYPPVDVSIYYPGCVERDAVKRELGIPLTDTVVGTVANVNPQKGYKHFVRSAALISRQLPDVTFLAVGGIYDTHKTYAAQVRALVADLGLSDKIIFAGGRDDVERMFSAMDVSLITSVPRSEGTTTTAHESMAVGTPVVTTDVGAVREIVEDAVTGYVVPPLDPQATAEATVRLLTDADLRARMSSDGRKRVVERFSVEKCAEVHLQAYEFALRNGGRNVHSETAATSRWRSGVEVRTDE